MGWRTAREGGAACPQRQREQFFGKTRVREVVASRGSYERAGSTEPRAPDTPSRTAQTLGTGVSSRGPCAARSSSRARDAAFTVHGSWPYPGLRASPASSASPQPGLRRHLLAGRLLRASGARGRAPGLSQGPARGRVAGADRARGCAVRLGPGGPGPRLAPVPPSRARGARGVARPGAEAQRPPRTAAKGGQVERKV